MKRIVLWVATFVFNNVQHYPCPIRAGEWMGQWKRTIPNRAKASSFHVFY